MWLGGAGLLTLLGLAATTYGFAVGAADNTSLLVVGIVLSLLLGASTYSLGAGRVQWRVQIDKGNHELRFQALHDALTGLPNRA